MGERRFSKSLSDRAVAADDSSSDHSNTESCREDKERQTEKDCQTLPQTVGRLGQTLLLRTQGASHSPRDMTDGNGPAVDVNKSAVRPPLDVDVADKKGHRRSRKARSYQGTESISRTADLFDDKGGTRSAGQRRSRNARSYQGTKPVRPVDLFDDEDDAANTRSTRRSRNARSFQGKHIRTVDFDGDEGAVNTRSTGQRRSRKAMSFQGKSIRTVDFDGGGGDEGPATFRDSFPLSRKEDNARNRKNKTFHGGHEGHNQKHTDLLAGLDDDDQKRHQKSKSFHRGIERNHSELFAELFADDDGPTRHKENSRSFQGENSLVNGDPSYDSNHHGSSFKQALAESRSKPKKQRSFQGAIGIDNDCKPSSARSSSHKSFHAVESSGDDHDNRRRGRPKLGRTMPPRGFKLHRRASIESTKSSSARATYLPRLELGDVGSNDDMIAENDHQAALELLDSLEKHSFCFTRRSNGTYTYSIVTEKDDRSMTVEVDETGSTKSCTRKDWPANFRLVNRDARLKKLDEKVLRPQRPEWHESRRGTILSLFD